MLKRKLLISILSFYITGCAHNEPVYVPVTMKCQIKDIPLRPLLPLNELNSESKPNEIIKAYVITVNRLKNYSSKLEILLRSCK